MRYKLEIAQHKWLIMEKVNEYWYQVVDTYNCVVEAKIGQMIRKSLRGWEVFVSLEANAPRHVIPNAVRVWKTIEFENGEEE